jgi:hypothetical protein
VKIISLIVAGLPAVVCFNVAFSFVDAAENAKSPKHIEKNEDFPKADLNGDGVVDTTIVVRINIFLKSICRVLVLENSNANK